MSQPRVESGCQVLQQEVLQMRDLIVVSNRGPYSIQISEDGKIEYNRSGGGLVTALLGLANQVPVSWIACAMGEEDRHWHQGQIPLDENGHSLFMRFIRPEMEAYDSYYQVISNPLLWFLQHSMWDFATAPTINRLTWQAWELGYLAVNRLFAETVVEEINHGGRPALVMLQDYHLYLAPRMIRSMLRGRRNTLLTHFIHIPWPGPEDWSLLPAKMREAILDGLCAVDLLGFQTRDDAMSFIRTCESLLPGAHVNYRSGRVTFNNHVTHVRDFPISIDVTAVQAAGQTEEVQQFREQIEQSVGDQKIILRIDRTEPSKNIVRGFQAFDEMLELHPEHHGKVQFLALMVPSRLEVEEYQDYLNSLMAAAGQVNVKYGTSEWEPVRVLVGESYPRALAAMQLYDVLLVNPVADGMNLVAKEGPTVNQKNGVVVLSERAGAHQQLGAHALVIAPCDVSDTAEALHRALIMPEDERRDHAEALRESVMREDIHLWLCWQLDTIDMLVNANRESKKRGNTA